MAGADKHEAHPLFGHNRPLIAAVLLLYTIGVSLAAYAYGQNSSLSSEQAFVTEHWKSAAEKYQEELQLLNAKCTPLLTQQAAEEMINTPNPVGNDNVSLAAHAYGQNSSLSSEQAFVTEHWKSAAEKYQEELQLLNAKCSSLSSEQAFVTEHWKSAAEKYQEELQLLNAKCTPLLTQQAAEEMINTPNPVGNDKCAVPEVFEKLAKLYNGRRDLERKLSKEKAKDRLAGFQAKLHTLELTVGDFEGCVKYFMPNALLKFKMERAPIEAEQAKKTLAALGRKNIKVSPVLANQLRKDIAQGSG